MASDVITQDTLERTGAFVVRFKDDCSAGDGADLLQRMLGRAPARSQNYAQRMGAFATALEDEGAAYFEQFGLAVLDPSRCGLDAAAIEAMTGEAFVASVRPEYRVRAIGSLWRLFGLGGTDPREGPVSPSDAAPAPAPTPPAQDREAAPGDIAAQNAVTWGLRAVRADATPFDGAGVRVAILDTGFALGHPDFEGRTIVAESFVRGETAEDGQGHGTHCAGTAVGPRAPADPPGYGVAPGADLFVAKVLSDSGFGREGDILAGILWAIENDCAVISLSLGRSAAPGDADGDYDRVGRFALENGALMIAAAGNDSQRRLGRVAPVGAPANARSVMAVAAIDESRAVADFSNGGLEPDGGQIDIAGPGVAVLSSVPGPRLRATLSGTSMATPHVSGVAALLVQSDPTLRGQALWQALTSTARDIGAPAQDVGAGLVQAPGAPVGTV